MIVLFVVILMSTVACDSFREGPNETSLNQKQHQQSKEHMNITLKDVQNSTKHSLAILRKSAWTSTPKQPSIPTPISVNPADVFDLEDFDVTESGEPANFLDSTNPISIPHLTTDTTIPWLPTTVFTTLATWDIGTNWWNTPATPSQITHTFSEEPLTQIDHFSTTKTIIDRSLLYLYSIFTHTATTTTTTTTTPRTTRFTTKPTEPIIYNPMMPFDRIDDDVVDLPDDVEETTQPSASKVTIDSRKIFYVHGKNQSLRQRHTKKHTHRSRPTTKHPKKRKRIHSITHKSHQSPNILRTFSSSVKSHRSSTIISSKHTNKKITNDKSRSPSTFTNSDVENFLKMNLRDHLIHFAIPRQEIVIGKTTNPHETLDVERIIKRNLYKARED